jgi:hypothetical protein
LRFDEDIQDLPTSLSFVYSDIDKKQLFPLIFDELKKLLPFIKEALGELESSENMLEDVEKDMEELDEESIKLHLEEKKCLPRENHFELLVNYTPTP